MRKLYIIGAGGFGREVAWLVRRINNVTPAWDLKGFIDDDASLWGRAEDGYKVLGGCDYLRAKGQSVWAVCAIGNARTRKKIVESFNEGVNFATLIDPSVIMGDSVTVGDGTIICAGTIITVDVSIGNHVIINLDSTIGHDDVIDDYVTLYPSVNVSGECHIGECTEIGTGSQIIQGLSVCSDSIIGAGAVVIQDIAESGTYVGVPAKRN